MMNRSLLPLLTAFALSVGCRSAQDAVVVDEMLPAKEASTEKGDPFNLTDVRVQGDSLLVAVRYGGGFKEHEFQLMTDGVATKSLPRQQPIRLVHDAHGDMGRALFSETRGFDLTPFRDPSQPAVLLLLQGWPDPLEYRYAR